MFLVVKLSIDSLARSSSGKGGEIMIVLVCGSRSWEDRGSIVSELGRLPEQTTIIHGDAHGADKLAGEVALELGFDVRVFPARWDTLGKAAGVLRNKHMLTLNPDFVIAFHDGKSRGSIDMMTRARGAGIKVVVIHKNEGPYFDK